MDELEGLTSPMPWHIDEDNAQRLVVVDARGEPVYAENWGGIPDEMSSAMREEIVMRARANARWMVRASDQSSVATSQCRDECGCTKEGRHERCL